MASRTASAVASERMTQAQRSARTRQALLEAAAQGLSRYGYAALSLAQVADDAGYTRGALYHQFAGKEELALAVVEWVRGTWQHDVGFIFEEPLAPADTLLALARLHAVYCRRDVAAVLLTLRVEFDQNNHPVGQAIQALVADLLQRCTKLVARGRADGSIPSGPPARDTARALISALEAVAIEVAGRPPHDITLTTRAAAGILGLPLSEPAVRHR